MERSQRGRGQHRGGRGGRQQDESYSGAERGGGQGQHRGGGYQNRGGSQQGESYSGADRGGGQGRHRGGGYQNRGGRQQDESYSGADRGGGQGQHRGGGYQNRGGRQQDESHSGADRGGGQGQHRGGGYQNRGGRQQDESYSGADRGAGQGQHRGGGYQNRGGRQQGEYREDDNRGGQFQGRGRGRDQTDYQRQDRRGHDRGGSARGRGGGHYQQSYDERKVYQFSPPTNLVKPNDPVCGTKGRKIVVETNYLNLRLGNLEKLRCFHYDVTIQPDKFKKLNSKVMEQFRLENYSDCHPSFDGLKNLYSSRKLKSEYCGEVSLTGDNSTSSKPFVFKVKLKFVKEIDTAPLHNFSKGASIKSIQEACQFLSVILRASPFLRCIKAGNNFFSPPENHKDIIDLSCGMELIHGLYQAPFLAQRGPMINIDVTHKAFPMAKNVLDLITEICNLNEVPRYLDKLQMRLVLDVIQDKKVEYTVNNLTINYTVNGFGRSAIEEKILSENTSVQKYFQTKKAYNIKHPDLQLLWVGSKEKDPKILIPVELCVLKRGQIPKRSVKDNPQVISQMIKKTATSTMERKEKIKKQIAIAGYKESPYLEEFGFSVDEEFAFVNARILDPPKLYYANNTVERPSKGKWDIKGAFLAAMNIDKWIIINLDQRVSIQKIQDLQKALIKEAGRLGMIVNNPDNCINIGRNNTEKDLEKALNTHRNHDLIIVLFSDRFNYYGTIKNLAEMDIGCLTQCLLSKTIYKDPIPYSVITNLLLKINAKLNGTNHRLLEKPSFLKGNVMMMGADVTHPGPQNKGIPSFAAVTASHDPFYFKYNAMCQLQPPTKEMITKLDTIVIQQLRFYHEHTKYLPDHIIFFRDGVSEGQFEDVKKHEVEAIRKACKALPIQNAYNPRITFVIVMKRHHTRFFPTDMKDVYDKNCNVPAGTCVDTGITHPVTLGLKDFFLASHSAIQGVTKPTKYCTVHDDAHFSYDDIEELAYYLCHMYSRCSRSVSYPAPTYYAHLAADRAKKLYENETVDWDELNLKEKIPVVTKIAKSRPMSFV